RFPGSDLPGSLVASTIRGAGSASVRIYSLFRVFGQISGGQPLKTNLHKLLFALAVATSFGGQNPPAAPDALLQAREAFRAGKFDTALEKYRSALQQSPNAVDGYAGLARTYLKMENVPLALETANKALGVAPSSPRAHAAMGEVYFRQAKMVEAEKEF